MQIENENEKDLEGILDKKNPRFIDKNLNWKSEIPVFIALVGVLIGIAGFLGWINIPIQKVFPICMLIVNFGFLFYKGRRTTFWKVSFLLMNAGWLWLSFML